MVTSDEVLTTVRSMGAIRSREAEARGISRKHLQRLAEQGFLYRATRGVYVPTDAALTETQSLVEVATRVPGGIFCLLTALRFHELTTQNPFEVWVALPPRARRPRLDYPPLRIASFTGDAFTEGMEEHQVGEALLRIYSPAKTVADCFKYRNKIGLDVALEALRDYRRKFRGGSDQLWHFAQVCRVANVMRPYMEAIG
jgi:predicted transcriptional regulator of viral defense system